MNSGGLAGSSTTPAFLPRARICGQRPMEMDGRAGFGLDEQVIGARLGEGAKVALGLDDHEMHIDGFRGRPPDGLQHNGPEGDIGHEPAVHHIHMDPVGAGRIDRAHLFAQPREIRR